MKVDDGKGFGWIRTERPLNVSVEGEGRAMCRGMKWMDRANGEVFGCQSRFWGSMNMGRIKAIE